MGPMSQEDLEGLSKEELIQLILEQAKQLAQMKADYEALKMKFKHNQKPRPNSKNSSQPPSRDPKRDQPKDKRKQRHGPPAGHERQERQFVSQPDQVVELRAKRCGQCQASLGNERGRLKRVNQMTELPEARAEVIEVRQYETICPCCGQVQVEAVPEGLDLERRFGARLEAMVVYYRQKQHMSYERTQQALRDLHGIEISQGGIDEIMQRAGKKAAARITQIQEQVQNSAVIHCDETTSRVAGNTWWEWVFCTVNAVLHVTRFNRSVDVIRDVMGNFKAEVWVSDCYKAQLNAPARQHQLCLAHQLRNLQAVVEECPMLTWPRAMQVLFRYAIHLHHLRSQLPVEEYAAQVARIERHCDRLLLRNLDPPSAKRIQKRYRTYRENLFVFLYREDVEPTNNVAERALRPSVIHRKVTGCFRSEWGVKAFAAFASIIDTAHLNGVSTFDAILSTIGSPALPIPVRGE